MLTITKAIILGIIQGITEWLPISSSGHLVLFQNIFGLEEQVGFDLVLHLASLIVVLFIFRKDIFLMLKSLYSFYGEINEFKRSNELNKTKQLKNASATKISIAKINSNYAKSLIMFFLENEHRKLALFIIIGTIPIAVFGLLLKDIVELAFTSLLIVGISFMITGVMLWLTKFRLNSKKTIKNMSLSDILYIGSFQALAIFPGISRSGSTIAGGILTGVDKNHAARISFLLFIPAIIGASLLELDKIYVLFNNPVASLAGFLSSLVISYVSIKFLLNIIKKGKFHYFAYYCFFIGLISLALHFILPII